MHMDYDEHGHGYSIRADLTRGLCRASMRRWATRTVANVGAGSGSYEPDDGYVLAFEPSQVMRAQRSSRLAPAISARAESLSLDDGSVDAAMAIFTVHHRADQMAGLKELRRIAWGPVAVLTIDVAMLPRYWLLAEYVPEVIEIDSRCLPAVELVTETLGGAANVERHSHLRGQISFNAGLVLVVCQPA
jgi:hypothetical protein